MFILYSVFQDCILQAIRDTITYFHISNERISGVFVEYETLITRPPHSADQAGTIQYNLFYSLFYVKSKYLLC